nr:Gag-Pol polyprotein [Tanacetum cinerariifolium]
MTEPITPTLNVNSEEKNNDQVADAQTDENEFYSIFSTSVREEAESSPRNEAMVDSAWIEAMQDELHQFDRPQVQELIDKPFGKTVTQLNWLWKNKKNEDQILIHNKSLLVAKGY